MRACNCEQAQELRKRIAELEEAANKVLETYMPMFNDSRAVDDCLVGLAAAVANVAPQRGVDHA